MKQYDTITQAVIDQEYEKAVAQMWEWLSEQFANLDEYEKKNPDKKMVINAKRENLRFIDRCFKIFMHKAKSMEQDAIYWQKAWKQKNAEVQMRRVRPEGMHPIEKLAIMKMLESDEVRSSQLYDPGFVNVIKVLLTQKDVPMRQTAKQVTLLNIANRLRTAQKTH